MFARYSKGADRNDSTSLKTGETHMAQETRAGTGVGYLIFCICITQQELGDLLR